MAGTTLNWRIGDILLGAGQIFANLAIPGAGARLTLDATTKTPDSTANPTAIHLGATQAGAVLKVGMSMQEYTVDEFKAPVVTEVEGVAASIEGSFAGILDTALLALLSPGVGTAGTGSGYAEIALGSKPLAYTSIAIIAPRHDDPTKMVVAQLYRALNTTGFEANFARTAMGFTPFNFKGYEVTTRAAADTLGKFWHEVAV
jgi:hypothetical protein